MEVVEKTVNQDRPRKFAKVFAGDPVYHPLVAGC